MPRKTLPQLQKQIAALQRQADVLRKKDAQGVIARIKEAITFYQLTPADLGFGNRAAKTPVDRKGKKTRRYVSRIKYRDGAGNAWTGHGRRPKWYVDALAAGKKPEDMAV
jgi:DNA-binding protein H-NS